MDEIKEIIEMSTGLDPTKKTRKHKYILAKGAFVYLCLKQGVYSYIEITDFLNLNRSTIYHYVNNIIPYIKQFRSEYLKRITERFELSFEGKTIDYKKEYYKLLNTLVESKKIKNKWN